MMSYYKCYLFKLENIGAHVRTQQEMCLTCFLPKSARLWSSFSESPPQSLDMRAATEPSLVKSKNREKFTSRIHPEDMAWFG